MFELLYQVANTRAQSRAVTWANERRGLLTPANRKPALSAKETVIYDTGISVSRTRKC